MTDLLLSPEFLVPVVTFAIGFAADYLLQDKKKKKVFNIFAGAVEESMEELGLDENKKYKTLYKIVDKLHESPEDTKKAEAEVVKKIKK